MPERVRLVGDPVLKQRCEKVVLPDTIVIPAVLDMMHETMKAEKGIGLAANQIGYPIQMFILKREDTYDEFINPELIAKSDLVDFEGEACLSIPGVSAKTKRYKLVRLAWYDKNGIRSESEFCDMQAFAIQHEMDHLNGKLYTDQLGPVKRNLVLGKHKKYLRGY